MACKLILGVDRDTLGEVFARGSELFEFGAPKISLFLIGGPISSIEVPSHFINTARGIGLSSSGFTFSTNSFRSNAGSSSFTALSTLNIL